MELNSTPAVAIRPVASIITVNTNEKHRMLLYMPSVWASRGSFEILISDNGSTDGSVEYIEANFPQTRIIKNGANLGFAAANNRAAEQAQSEILVFLNPDTTVEPDWLEELLKPFSDPAVGLTTSKLILMPDPAHLNTCGNDVHVSGITLCRGMGKPRENYAHDEDVAAVSGAAFAIRREIFEAVGGFNEAFFIYMEETAMSLEGQLRGWRCVYVCKSIVYHDYALRFGPRKILFQERNRYMMLLQIYRLPTLMILLPAFLLAEIITWGFVILRDRRNWQNKLLAYAGVLENWRSIRAKRLLNQAQRKVRDRELLAITTSRLDFGQVTRGPVALAAALIFTPLFGLFRLVALALVRW
ncbi:MAG TPA: glycosyltransferase family 2 protein [Gemmataceae bacterium]|nr:glycosyltransferase family 2 protein [Gemmataceae bacterium]